MTTIGLNVRTAMLVGAAVALLACGKEEAAASNNANVTTTEVTTTETTNTAAPAANAAAAGSTVLNADYMVGKWSAMNEDCSSTLEFRKDGTAITPIGPGKWTLAGDKLTFDYGEGSDLTASTIKVLGPDRIEITRSSGGTETEKRCP